jgi:hypothetical protein
MEEEELVLMTQEGNEQAFSSLVKNIKRKCLAWLLPSREIAMPLMIWPKNHSLKPILHYPSFDLNQNLEPGFFELLLTKSKII